MRQIRFIPVILGVLLCGCNADLINTGNPDNQNEMGEVVIDLSSDSLNNQTETKAGADSEIPVGDFSVEIFNSDAIRLFYSPKYSDITEPISLNSGNYRLLAKYGDSLGVGFNHAFYIADKPFEVRPQTQEEISAVAYLGNVKVKVVFGTGITSQFDDYYAIVRHSTLNKKLQFSKTEKRAGFIPAGDLVFEIYVKTEDGYKKYTHHPEEGFSPRDFVTFNVDTGIMEGKLNLTIKIDNSVDMIEKSYEIDRSAAETEGPKINLTGFDSDGCYTLDAGVPVNDPGMVSMSIFCSSDITSAQLSVTSAYIPSSPMTVELANISDSELQALESIGICPIIQGSLGAIDCAGLIKMLSTCSNYNGAGTVSATVSLSVKDSYDKTSSSEANVKVASSASLFINDYDIWASKVVSPQVTVISGSSEGLTLQYSPDAISWYEAGTTTGTSFGTVNGLMPGRQYVLRVKRNGIVISDSYYITTENANQLGNAGFEEWTSVPYSFSQGNASESSPMDWYMPEGSSTSGWWASNSVGTMRNNLTTLYTNFKCFPNVCWSSNYHSGAKSAQMMVINIGNSNSKWATTGNWYVGQMWIGTADASGNIASEGHSFESRPSSVQFYYEYAPYGTDSWKAEASVLAADGSVIATGELSSSSSVSSWQVGTVVLNYSVTNKKAATIKMKFTASTSGSHSCDTGGGTVEVAGRTREVVKISSVLRVDDINLVY